MEDTVSEKRKNLLVPELNRCDCGLRRPSFRRQRHSDCQAAGNLECAGADGNGRWSQRAAYDAYDPALVWIDAQPAERGCVRLQHGGCRPEQGVGSACSVTIEADITPLIANVDGLTFSGTDILAATLASPQFALNDYGSTSFSSAGGLEPADFTPGGVLLQGDAGNLLQLEDATMRAQFNKTGGSNYHLILHPNVLPAVTINVPYNQGGLFYFFGGQRCNLCGHRPKLVDFADHEPPDRVRSDPPGDLSHRQCHAGFIQEFGGDLLYYRVPRNECQRN